MSSTQVCSPSLNRLRRSAGASDSVLRGSKPGHVGFSSKQERVSPIHGRVSKNDLDGDIAEPYGQHRLVQPARLEPDSSHGRLFSEVKRIAEPIQRYGHAPQ